MKGVSMPFTVRRKTCPICRRACKLWQRLRQRKFAAGELAGYIGRVHGPPRGGGLWPVKRLNRPVEWVEG